MMRRRPALAHLGVARGLIAVTAMALLVGCSADGAVRPSPGPVDEEVAQPAPTPPPTNSPGVPTTPQPADGGVSETVVCSADDPAPEPFTGPAVEEFGADAVMDAYCESAAFFVQGVTNLTDPRQADPRTASRDLQFVADRLSVRAAQRWAGVTAAAATSPAAQRDLDDLTYYAVALPGRFSYPVEGPMAVDGRVSRAAADVATLSDGRTALALWYTVDTGLPVVRDGLRSAAHVFPLRRDVALYLVPNPDPDAGLNESWLFESWTTSWSAGSVESWRAGR